MDKIERYRQLIKQILSEHQQITSNTDTVNSQLILDNENDHYQLAEILNLYFFDKNSCKICVVIANGAK
jgi:hypothetical protein